MAHVEDLRKTKQATGRKRWRARYRDPTGRERCKSFNTKSEAERYLREVESQKDHGTWVDPTKGKILFKDWVEQWKLITPSQRPATESRNNRLLNKYVIPAFASRSLASLSSMEVQAWIVTLSESGLSSESVRKCYLLMNRILGSSLEHGLLTMNPSSRTKLPKSTDQREMQFFTDTELFAIATQVPVEYRALILVGGYGGLRIGELAGLQRRSVGPNSVSVVRQVTLVDGILEVSSLKTKASKRVVPLPGYVAREMVVHLARHVPTDPEAHVFTAPDGGLLHRINFGQRVWTPALRRLGLEGRVHDLRHTAVSIWISQGINPKKVSRWAGHTSVSFTLDRYGHLYPEDDQQDLDALDARIGRVSDLSNVLPFRRDVPRNVPGHPTKG